MAGRFHAESFSCSTKQGDCETTPDFEPNRPGQDCQFVEDFQPIVGDDAEPDPLFFVECWTLGTSAAATNFQQRRQRQAASELSCQAFRDLYSSRALSILQQRDMDAKALSAIGAAVSARRSYADWSRQDAEEFTAQMQDETPQQGRRFAEPWNSRQETVHSMTRQSACRLLGVAATSTREQIKTAYRQMASQWHPDRLKLKTKQEIGIATEQMAAINEAYHLLRSCTPGESARSDSN